MNPVGCGCGGRREHAHFIPCVACPSENFVVDATLLCAFAAAPRGRAGFFVVVGGRGGAGPVDGSTQLVLCGKEPFGKAADLLCLKAFARDGSTCLKEERVFQCI